MTVEEKFEVFLQQLDQKCDSKKLSLILDKNTFVEIVNRDIGSHIDALVSSGYLTVISLNIWDSIILKYRLQFTDKAIHHAKSLKITA